MGEPTWARPAGCDASRGDGLSWRKSSRSAANGHCLAAAIHDGRVHVRDTKHPGGPVLTFRPHAWRSFTATTSIERRNPR